MDDMYQGRETPPGLALPLGQNDRRCQVAFLGQDFEDPAAAVPGIVEIAHDREQLRGAAVKGKRGGHMSHAAGLAIRGNLLECRFENRNQPRFKPLSTVVDVGFA